MSKQKYPYGEYADLNYWRCPWGSRFIYEKRWVCMRDDRYQPLGGFVANGEPRRVLDVTIRRVRDWRADAPTRILSARSTYPHRNFIRPHLLLLVVISTADAEADLFVGENMTSGEIIFKFHQARILSTDDLQRSNS